MVPYDDAHPFTAQAVFAGRVTHASREELRATVAPDAGRGRGGLGDRGPAGARAGGRRAGRRAGHRLGRAGRDPDDDEAARVLAGGRPGRRPRRRALRGDPRDRARPPPRLGRAAARAPEPQVPDTAAVTAFCAWQSGHGALAWCALDRCFDVDPEHRLGRVWPSAWCGPCRRRRGRRWSTAPELARFPGRGGAPRVTAWERTSTHKSSLGPTARATARRSTAASTCSSGCSASTSSTPTTR